MTIINAVLVKPHGSLEGKWKLAKGRNGSLLEASKGTYQNMFDNVWSLHAITHRYHSQSGPSRQPFRTPMWLGLLAD